MQYRKKVFLKDFVLDEEGLITKADLIRISRDNLFERGNPYMNRDRVW